MSKKNFKITGQEILVKDEMIFFPSKKRINSKKYRFENDSIDNDDEENTNNALSDFNYNDENEDKEEFGGKTKYQAVWKSGNILNNNLRFI
jgi:hypothetical protein